MRGLCELVLSTSPSDESPLLTSMRQKPLAAPDARLRWRPPR
ncbi:MAG: hypothetical protein AAF711_18820 [Planctomycetota bacterium]